MKVSKITNIFSKKSNITNSGNKQDLTSFGVQEKQNSNMLISKTTADALKNKYGANVSFNGHHKTVYITEKGETLSKQYLYGSNGIVMYRLKDYAGHSYHGKDYLGEDNTTRWVSEGYTAIVDGTENEGKHMYSAKYALEDAVRNSKYFIENSKIEQIREIKENDHKSSPDVYFSDRNETVSRSIINDKSVNYIVFAPNAKLEPLPPAPKKKSLLQRIFG